MKKLTAIFFLILFSFNWFGYRLMYDVAQQKNNQHLEALLDKSDYDESQLIELKVAMNLPYQTSRSSFERYDGEIELNGTMYKYVKRKVANDTLYLMCIPNTKKMRLETAKNDFFKVSNDLEQNNNSKNTDNGLSVFKYMTVYNDSSFGAEIISPDISQENFWLAEKSESLQPSTHLSPEQPPEYGQA
ncbi:MAG: hypothetical protein ABJA32_01170 [Ginsengibacter sp.]